MKVSLVCNNENFLEYLSSSTGVQLQNAYSTLSEEATFTKFCKDFNYVDTLLFVDFQDISKEFMALVRHFQEGKTYFLQAEEILLVTYTNPTLSPTPDLESSLEAITSFMKKLNYNFRVVRLETLKFQDIYKSISSSDSIKETTITKYTKYKVLDNGEGIVISPKKNKTTILPDTIKGVAGNHKLEDLQAAKLLDSVTVEVPEIIEKVRLEKDFKDTAMLSVLDSIVVFISGLRYSGKTTLALKLAKEFQDQNLTSAVLDLTGRRDITTLSELVETDIEFMKTLTMEGLTGASVVAFQSHHKVHSGTFVSQVLKHVLSSRTVTFCEIDLEEAEDLYTSYRGDKVLLLVTPNSVTHIRDTTNYANKIGQRVIPVLNNVYNADGTVDLSSLKENFNNAKQAFSIDELPNLVASLLK